MIDGRVARFTGRYSEFGVHLDTIADFLGFGVAPALMAWAWLLRDLGGIGFALCFGYTVCAAFRLARFNVSALEGSWNLPGHSQGLTTTMAGGTLVTLIWVANDYLRAWLSPSPMVLGAFVGFLGLLMVSNFPFRSFRDLRANRNAARLLGVSLALCLTGAVVLDVSMLWGIGAVLYLAIGLADAVVFAFQRRRLRNALLLEEIEEALLEDEPVEAETT